MHSSPVDDSSYKANSLRHPDLDALIVFTVSEI